MYFDPKYNPNHGYEPYWPGGNWVFKDKTLPPGVTTTPIPLVCGEECEPIYTGIGEVCGRQVNNQEVDGCWPSMLWNCYGNTIDEHRPGYHTFISYCRFLDAQCRSPFNEKWFFVHNGPCLDNITEVLRPLNTGELMLSRLPYYFTRLSKEFYEKRIPDPFRT